MLTDRLCVVDNHLEARTHSHPQLTNTSAHSCTIQDASWTSGKT